MQKLTINLEKQANADNVYLAHFEGAFDGSQKEPLTELENLVKSDDSKKVLVFDFEKLDYLNSYAIGQLVAWQNHLIKSHGQILITSLNKNVEDILSILGISNLFKIFPDVESALQTASS